IGNVRIRRNRVRGADQVDGMKIHQPVGGNVEKLIRRLGSQHRLVAAESRRKARVLHPIVECAERRRAGSEVRRRITIHPGERRMSQSIASADYKPVPLPIQTKHLRRPGKSEAWLEVELLYREEVP